jgi:hypothetical protein
MSSRGFSLEVVYCETCGESAEGIPDSFVAEGLPEGWYAVRSERYETPTRDEDRPNQSRHEKTLYYCSSAHLPSDLLPEDIEEEGRPVARQ